MKGRGRNYRVGSVVHARDGLAYARCGLLVLKTREDGKITGLGRRTRSDVSCMACLTAERRT